MAFFMFIDESGQDQRESPYEVLAGIVVHDSKLWPLVQALHKAELGIFGRRYASIERELKAKKLLKTKVFRHAALREPFNREMRLQLAAECLSDGAGASPEHYAALGQAKLAYCAKALSVASQFGCRLFASIVPKDAPRPSSADHLRKDYAFLFERFFFYLELHTASERGIVVFDELEHSQSNVLIDQMERYFIDTYTGRQRVSRIIPEPFFVHSHLTTGVHLADLVAYIISWGVRDDARLRAPGRPELSHLAQQTSALAVDMTIGTRQVWAFNVIADLRSRAERGISLRPDGSRRGGT